MFRLTTSLAFALGIIFCVATGAGGAVFNDSLKVRLDRAVHVGESELPAGDYSIRMLELSGGTPFLTIESIDTGGKLFVSVRRCTTATGEKAVKTKLVFGQTGDELYLTKIWLEGHRDGFEVIQRLPSVQ